MMTMNLEETLTQLKALGTDKMRRQYSKNGAGAPHPLAPIWVKEMVSRQG